MTRGLVIGKFMPLHEGHIALINFAASQCDELIVSMSYTDVDPIPPLLRFSWITEIFSNRNSIKPAMIRDDFDDESLAWPERTKVWSDLIRRTYPPIDILFASEEYGGSFALNLNAEYRPFDPDRKKINISATKIRLNPMGHWQFIPPIVRPYYLKKVCFYGPESTGKSTMAVELAHHYQTEFVPEVARELITSNDFSLDDIIKIGIAHADRIKSKSKTANKILFCDTDVITTQIYSYHYLGEVPPILFDFEKDTRYDHYFLFDIDTPWVEDGLRDLGHKRQEMFLLFKSELQNRKIPYTLLSGPWGDKKATIMAWVDSVVVK